MESELLNLLVLPLLGGYVFFSRLHWTSFAAKKMEGQRLIYCSSVIAVLLILAARALELGIEALDRRPDLNSSMVSASVAVTLVTQAVAALILITAVSGGDLDDPRNPDHLPRAAAWCAALLLILLVPIYARFFDYLPWHLLVAAVGTVATLCLVVFVAEWVIETSSQAPATAAVRVALLLFALSAGITFVLIYGVAISHWWGSEFSSIRYSGLALLAAAIGAIAWMPINVILTDRWGWRWAHVRGQTSGLEILLYSAWIKKSAMQLTLQDGKVYIGYVLEMPAPKPNLDGSCIEFTPMSSGYRKADKTVRITTDYAGVIDKLRAEAGEKNRDVKATLKSALDRLTKVVPISEVSVAALYSDQYIATDLTARTRRTKQPTAQPSGNGAPASATAV
jgi:hypothetical protein